MTCGVGGVVIHSTRHLYKSPQDMTNGATNLQHVENFVPGVV